MSFTQKSVNYNKVQEHIKGITFISPGSIKFLKAAYEGKLEEAAKLLAGYMWRTTRDTTMILITVALLVLAEKSKILAEKNKEKVLSEKNKEKLETKLKLTEQQIRNILVNMSEGNGKQAKEKAAALEGIFKSILLKNYSTEEYEKNKDKINKKVDGIWTGYLNQIGRITKWKYSKNTMYENVYNVLRNTLKPQLFQYFVCLDDNWKPEVAKKAHSRPNKNSTTVMEDAINNIKEDVEKKLAQEDITFAEKDDLILRIDDDDRSRKLFNDPRDYRFAGPIKWQTSPEGIRYWNFAHVNNTDDLTKKETYKVYIWFSRVDCNRYLEKKLAEQTDEEKVKAFEKLFKSNIDEMIPTLKLKTIPSMVDIYVPDDLKEEFKEKLTNVYLQKKDITGAMILENPFKVQRLKNSIILDKKSLVAHLMQNKLYRREEIKKEIKKEIKNEIKKYLAPILKQQTD